MTSNYSEESFENAWLKLYFLCKIDTIESYVGWQVYIFFRDWVWPGGGIGLTLSAMVPGSASAHAAAQGAWQATARPPQRPPQPAAPPLYHLYRVCALTTNLYQTTAKGRWYHAYPLGRGQTDLNFMITRKWMFKINPGSSILSKRQTFLKIFKTPKMVTVLGLAQYFLHNFIQTDCKNDEIISEISCHVPITSLYIIHNI